MSIQPFTAQVLDHKQAENYVKTGAAGTYRVGKLSCLAGCKARVCEYHRWRLVPALPSPSTLLMQYQTQDAKRI
jgi:hypothetical protein